MNETDKAVARVIESAGKVAPELWVEMVAAEKLQACVAIISLLLFSIVLSCIAKKLVDVGKKERADDRYSSYNGTGWFVSAGASLFFSFLMLVAAACWLDNAVYPQASVVTSVMSCR
jgi:hypothetical protein